MSPENRDQIEARLEQYRAEKAGTAAADMITPLKGMENMNYFVARDQTIDDDGRKLDEGRFDDGWKVSAANEEMITLFKPELDEDGLHVKTRDVPIDEFNRVQDAADRIKDAGDDANTARGRRVLQISALMDGIRQGTKSPSIGSRDDIK